MSRLSIAILGVTLSLFCCVPLSYAQQLSISIKGTRFLAYLEDAPGDELVLVLKVIIYGPQPSSDQAEKVLRFCLAASVALHSKNDILAFALHSASRSEDDERRIPLTDGSRSLIYSSKDETIQTWKEHEGVATKTVSRDQEGYFVEYEEREVLVQPGMKFAVLNVVFAERPDREAAYAAILAELKNSVAGRDTQWRTTAYAYVGTRSDPAKREQIKDPADDAFIFAKYDPATGTIARRGQELMRIGEQVGSDLEQQAAAKPTTDDAATQRTDAERRVDEACQNLPTHHVVKLREIAWKKRSNKRRQVIKALRSWCKESDVEIDSTYQRCLSAISKAAVANLLTPTQTADP